MAPELCQLCPERGVEVHTVAPAIHRSAFIMGVVAMVGDFAIRQDERGWRETKKVDAKIQLRHSRRKNWS